MTPAPVLSIRDVTKSYGSNVVLTGVDLDVRPGEKAALLGENGAGKSTLAKIIAGAVSPTGGVIDCGGRRVAFATPRDALAAGVAFIPQELVYVPELTVAENICLGAPPTRLGFTSQRVMADYARAATERAGFDLPLGERMSTLSLAQRQLVEIAKAIARDARLLILDEPTAALEAEDSRRLHELVDALSRDGVGIVYISHRLDEVFATCDTVHVLRNGDLVRSSPVAAVTPAEVIADMLGRPEAEDDRSDRTTDLGGPPALSVSELSRRTSPRLDDVSFTVGRGEIVGLYGLRGSGADTVAETLGGLHPDAEGSFRILDRTIARISGPRDARRLGVSYVPADRKSQGLVLGDSIVRSLALPNLRQLSRRGFLRSRAERGLADDLMSRVRVRAQSAQQSVGELSGGNQQKVLVGSRLASEQPVLVLHEPSRGVDIGARREIHDLLRSLAADGTAELVVTSDIEEAVTLCDRLLIMRRGRIVHSITRPTPASQSEALTAAGGLS